MRLKVSVLIPLSIVLGLASVQAGRTWLNRQMDERARLLDSRNVVRPQQFATLVVAAEPLRFGSELTMGSLKEIPWPEDQLPKGAFAKVSDLVAAKGRRQALAAIEINEPILEGKITGSGQRANLASIIEDGKKAITVRVDDIVGVAGFILPGDRVDVLLTRKSGEINAVSDNILQNIKVLAIDQKADERLDKPSIARAVTLEVSTGQAQKLNVAQSVGSLSLILRPVGSAAGEVQQRVSTNSLLSGADMPKGVAQPGGTTPVTVTRSTERREYTVPSERGR